MSLSLADIEQLFLQAGRRQYSGEAISQLEHALQAASLAEQDSAADSLVVASLLHDLGHLLGPEGQDDPAQGRDDLHQYQVLPYLRALFDDAVLQAIALHVEAKRYLCQSEAGYLAKLSPASRLSLHLQGGPHSADAAEAFLAKPYAAAAVALRRYDDAAKVPGLLTPDFAHFLPRLQRLARTESA